MAERNLNILFTSAGRRVGLMELFRAALRSVGVSGRIFAGDADSTAPTLHRADQMVVLPPVASTEYVDVLRTYCMENDIGLVVPLIDPELDVLANVRESLLRDGIMVMVSAKSAIEMVQDKLQTAQLFAAVGLLDRKPWRSLHGRLNRCLIRRPSLVLKPRFGSSGKGIFVCSTPLPWSCARSKVYIAQQFVDGTR